jgi:hypothetical protein
MISTLYVDSISLSLSDSYNSPTPHVHIPHAHRLTQLNLCAICSPLYGICTNKASHTGT